MRITREMGAQADLYRQQNGCPCQSCRARFPKNELTSMKVGANRRTLCLGCARKVRTAKREQMAAAEAARNA